MSPFTPQELLERWYRDEDCHDCGVSIGGEHGDMCDVARCLHTGLQRLSCGGEDADGVHDCGAAVHDGHWPGERECAEYGWYLHFGDHIMPDVNRLIYDGVWDRERGRWVPKDGVTLGTVDAAMEWFLGRGLVVKTSELDPVIVIADLTVRITLRRAWAWQVAWALETFALCDAEEGETFLGDGRSRIRVDRAQAKELHRILLKIHSKDREDGVTGRKDVQPTITPE